MYARILVPIDDSAAAAVGLKEAVRIARLCDAQLRLLHVVADLPFVSEDAVYQTVPRDAAESLLLAASKLVTHLRDEAIREGAKVDYVVVESAGRRPDEIVNEQAAAWKADLIVLGTHGRRGVERFVAGSVAEQVVRHADIPVLLVRSRVDGGEEGGLQSIAAAIA